MSCERYQAATEILEILYDRAVNRYLEQSNFDVRDHLTDEELRQYEAAEAVELDHNSNRSHAPDIGKVVVEVLGGVAEVTGQPEGAEVEILDHDSEQQERTPCIN
jgi:hypothetical protein